MTQVCRPAKCIEAIRVALLDQCTLLPICGPLNGYAMGCIIDPNWNPEIEEGEESIVKDNCGNICLRDDRCDLTKRWNLEFKIKDPDKEFLSLIEGNPLIIDGGGNSIGVRQLSYGACTPYLFVEFFERTDDCEADGDPIYIRHVFPAVRLRWTGNEREGIFRILSIEGKTRDVLTDSIGTGPFADIPVGALVGASATERIDYAWFEDDFVPAVACGAIEVPCPPVLPTVASASSPACEQYVLTGTGFDGVNRIQIQGAAPLPTYYYDPAGPDFALNPVTATINAWTATSIDITDTQWNGTLTTQVEMWGGSEPTNLPSLGTFDYADFVIADCVPPPQPQVSGGVSSPECERVILQGTDLDLINKLRLDGGAPLPVFYYDPAGPDFALNPVTATINFWTSTLIDITDTQFNATLATQVEMWGGSEPTNLPAYGIFNFPDFVIDDCVPGLGYVLLSEVVDPQAGGVDVVYDSVGRLLIAATVPDGGGIPSIGIWRLLDDGTPDVTFGVNGLSVVTTGVLSRAAGITVDLSDDSVYASGIYDATGASDAVVAKVDSAGVLDVTWGVAGIATVAAGGNSASKHGIKIEADGRIVVGWNDDGTGIGTLERLDAVGTPIAPDQVSATGRIVAVERYGADGVYAVGIWEPGPDYVSVGVATLGTGVVQSVPTGTIDRDTTQPLNLRGVGLDVTAGGEIYVSGTENVFNLPTVARFTAALVLDPTFAGTGQMEVWATSSGALTSVRELAGGDVLLSGYAQDAGEYQALSARVDSAGVLVGTYGTAGVELYDFDAGVLDQRFIGLVLDEANGGAVHVGHVNTGAAASWQVVAAKTLLADGSLDPSFG